MHIHVYKTIGMFECDTESNDPVEAKKEALEQIGEMEMKDPDIRWIAISHETSFIGSQPDETKKDTKDQEK